MVEVKCMRWQKKNGTVRCSTGVLLTFSKDAVQSTQQAKKQKIHHV